MTIWKETPFEEEGEQTELLDEYELFQEADKSEVKDCGTPSREMSRREILREIYEDIQIPETDPWEEFKKIIAEIIADPTIPF